MVIQGAIEIMKDQISAFNSPIRRSSSSLTIGSSFRVLALGLLLLMALTSASAQTTAFSYQGTLNVGGNPANGSYDLQFKIFDALTAGTQQGVTVTRSAVAVVNGQFAVSLDFGAGVFPGSDRFLEIAAQPAGGGGFTTLSPRIQTLSTPYAIRAASAQSAGFAVVSGGFSGPVTGNNSTAIVSASNNAPGITPNSGTPPAALVGSATGSTGQTVGVFGTAESVNGMGVLGITNGGGGGGAPSVGVFGVATSSSGPANGVMGETSSSNGWGVHGNALATTGPANGVVGDSYSPNGSALVGRSFGTGDILTLISTVAGGNPKVRVLASGEMVSLGSINAFNGFRSSSGPISVGGTSDLPMFRVNNLGQISTMGSITVTDALGTTALFKVDSAGLVSPTLGSAGATALCKNASGQISTCSSSLRYKTNINRFGFGLKLVNQLNPITFDWKQGGMRDLGLGAEDVAAIEPLLVTYNDRGEVEGVKYDRIGIVLVNAVKEQQTQIEAQDAKIKALEMQLEAFKALLCSQNASADVCRPKK